LLRVVGVYKRQVSKPSAKMKPLLTTTPNVGLVPVSAPLVADSVLPLARV
jgi:hypothetical protein